MDTAEIIDALAENNLDLARSKINTALNEKAVEAMKARKVELGASYFTPKAE